MRVGEAPGSRWRRARVTVFLLLAASGSALGQVQNLNDDPFDSSYLEPRPTAAPGSGESTLTFRLDHEIPLPGPLETVGPRIVSGAIEIPVAGGRVRSGWAEDAVPALIDSGSGAPDGDEAAWAVAPDGRYRARVDGRERLVVQKRRRHGRRHWKNAWTLRVAGVSPAPPLITDKRIYYGSMDNRVYAARRRNGHRLWEADVEGRATRRLALWRAKPDGEREPRRSLVLVVPDLGGRLIALDARSGVRAASYTVPEDGGKLVGAPLALPDGQVVVARQRYAPGEASLMVFDLVSAPTDQARRGPTADVSPPVGAAPGG